MAMNTGQFLNYKGDLRAIEIKAQAQASFCYYFP